MPSKPLLSEARFSWIGGLNTTLNPDQLGLDELVDATNIRLDASTGALAKRTGTRRLHAAAIGGGNPVLGLIQWDTPSSGSQIVAISNGNLYHRLQSAGEFSAFTEVSSSLSTTFPSIMVPFRTTSAGAALVLYIASNGVFYTWTGTTLTRIDGTLNAPDARLLAPYHTRLFAVLDDELKTLHWSFIGNGSDWQIVVNDLTSGGNNPVDLLTGEAVVALGVVGSSLVCATEDSLVRFTGYAADDIRIAQDTEGISAVHGPTGPLAMVGVEEFLAMLSRTGPYLIEEAGVRPIGFKVEPSFDGLNRASLDDAALVYHRGRRELWYAVRGSGDAANRTIFCWASRIQAWAGPWTYPFSINTLVRYEDPLGDEYAIAGCADGFIRHMDTGALDDVLSDGTSGSAYQMSVEFPPIHFSPGPASLKSLRTIVLNLDSSAANFLIGLALDDDAGFTDFTLTASGSTGRVNANRLDLPGQANRIRLRFRDDTLSEIPILHGFQLYAYDMQRVFT